MGKDTVVPKGNRLYVRNRAVIAAEVDGELVMMSVEHGQYYGLAGIGPRLWELLEEPRSLEDLVQQVLEEFAVEQEVCRKDTVEFLEEMERLGLVERG